MRSGEHRAESGEQGAESPVSKAWNLERASSLSAGKLSFAALLVTIISTTPPVCVSEWITNSYINQPCARLPGLRWYPSSITQFDQVAPESLIKDST